jgi:hypothetical protein
VDLHTVAVHEADDAQGRVRIVVLVGACVPDAFFNQGELLEESLNVELEIGVSRISVVASTDQLCTAKIQADTPAVFEQLAVETDATYADEWFKQLSQLSDQARDPRRSSVSLSATGSMCFDLLQQVIDRNVRVGQWVSPPVVIISIASFVDFVTVLLTDTDGPLPERSPRSGHGNGHTAYRGIVAQRATTNHIGLSKRHVGRTIVRLGPNIASVWATNWMWCNEGARTYDCGAYVLRDPASGISLAD